MTFILGSKSGTRRAMLMAAGVPFEVRSPDGFDEDATKADLRADGLDARGLAAALARAKALAVAADGDDIVLGADQTLERDDGTMLDKPVSRADAAGQLRSLRGRPHRLHAAAAIAQDGKIRWEEVQTVTLYVRPFSDAFLELYLDAEYDAVRFNVGGYRIEGPGAQLFERVEGSHFAILGLPLLPLLDYLRLRGILES